MDLFTFAVRHARQEFPVMHGSDVDYTDRLCGLSDADLSAREEETAREQRWAEFVTRVRYEFNIFSHCGVVSEVARALNLFLSDQDNDFHQAVRDFAVTEGESSVLRAVARALDEDAAAQRELMDRR